MASGLCRLKRKNALLNEKLKVMEKQMEEIYALTRKLYDKKNFLTKDF
jgi:uncharacterized protein YoxC